MTDPARWERVQEIFLAALDLPEADRPAFVATASGDDDALAAEVHSLLAAHEDERFLADTPDASDAPRLYGLPSDRIGPYSILRPLGQGGMGTVFLAERSTEDLTQVVALKLLRTDFAIPQLLERFRNERRILARLEHPGIARLIDAGAAPTGQPFFAMEFVEGVNLMEYVHANRLSVRDRLRLFLEVCDAVEYAHQQLVVHRDLKPSNILVGEDGRPKLLDFGIAKIVQPDDIGSALPITRTGRFFTPEYASPEQVRGEPQTTLSDVYALGVLLHELLTSERPFELRSLSPSEAEHTVCHVQPKRPSDRVVEPRMRRLLVGDLDTIVLKALAKEPSRRYSSVRALHDDLRRYLERKPVRARPDRWTYRASKFVQRHRTAATAVSLAFFSLIAGLGTVLWQGSVARRERDRAETALRQSEDVTDFLTSLFQAADPRETTVDTVAARAILRRGAAQVDALADQPLLQARMLDALAKVFRSLGEYRRAHEMVSRSLELRRANLEPGHPDIGSSLRGLGQTLRMLSRYEEAEAAYLGALAIFEKRPGAGSPEVASTFEDLGFLMPYLGRPADATRYYREALALNRRLYDEDDPAITADLLLVGLSLRRQGNYEEALSLIREAVARSRRDPGEEDAETGISLFHLADVIVEGGADSAEAEALYREGIAIRRRAGGDRDLGAIHGMENLASLLSAQGQHGEAERLLREALDLRLNALGPNSPPVANSLSLLAGELARQGRLDDAIDMERRTLATWKQAVGAEHTSIATAMLELGLMLTQAGRYGEAETLIRDGLAMRIRLHGPEHVLVGLAYVDLGELLTHRRAFAEAESSLLEAARILELHQTPRHVDLRRVHERLADLYGAMGRTEPAAHYRRLAEP